MRLKQPKTNTRLRPSHVLGSLALAAILALAVAQPGAAGIEQLQSQISDARAEAQALAEQIDSASAALAAAQERAIAAAQEEARLTAVLERGLAREARLESAVTTASEQLAATRARFGRSQDALADRLVSIYRSPMPDATSLLLEAEDFDDLATRSEYLTRIQDADASLVTRVRAMREQVAARLAQVEAAEQRAQAFNERVAGARDEIAAVRADAEAESAALASLRAERESAVESLQAQVGRWAEQVQRLERISERQARAQVGEWFGDWAIPESIVMCESGGNWDAVNPSSGAGGAYQILPSTWELYGGEGLPQDASPAEQSAIAAQIWADSGQAAWVC